MQLKISTYLLLVDFTSSLYLGIEHSSTELGAWRHLTSGVPSAIFEPSNSTELACQVARMQGLEYGFTAPSTLHLYYDIYHLLSKQPVIIFIDEYIYPVSKYGIEKMFLNKIPVHQFRHLDAVHLQELVAAKTGKYRTPIVLTDGWCPQCGQPAPINLYSEILTPYGGSIVIDDTQALGIFGKRTGNASYGIGGGGILNWLNVNDPNIICIVSLAKAFGVPLSVINGSNEFIKSFKNTSETISYSSPPSLVHLRAGLESLHINQRSGDNLRRKLFNNVSLIRRLLKETGLNVNGGIFPQQSLLFGNTVEAVITFKSLLKQGIKTVITTGHHNNSPFITFVIRSDHSTSDIDTLSYCIKKSVRIGTKSATDVPYINFMLDTVKIVCIISIGNSKITPEKLFEIFIAR